MRSLEHGIQGTLPGTRGPLYMLAVTAGGRKPFFMSLRIRMIERLSEISREAWDAVANPAGAAYDPFLSWNFLEALESSGCAVEDTGWGPKHLLAEDEATGALVGALPLYLKGHSYGEFVFDHGWANAFETAGGQYYPKLLTAIPFTPATGRRVLASHRDVQVALVEAARHVVGEWGLSSWHVLFPEEAAWQALGEAGLLKRCDIQFIWTNRGYASYDDFLADLSSRKRKSLRKERAAACEGLTIEALRGSDLTEHHWDVFFACYQETGARKWGTPYLNREFFALIHERMADDVLLVMARNEAGYIAAALNFIGSHALFGRYWGILEHRDNLHFELCYHRAIDFAIEHRLERVEAGAQGPHKMPRGYRPQAVYSAHYLPNESFADAVDRYLRRERVAIAQEIEDLGTEMPFKQDL